MIDEFWEKMGGVVVKVGEVIKYEGVGIVEFFVDKYWNFYFMEMNIWIQVEYLVIEEVIDYDLIKEQIKIVVGEFIKGGNYYFNVYVMECWINVEDFFNGFCLSLGKIVFFYSFKGYGVWVDISVYVGYIILFYYDFMIVKFICWVLICEECIKKMECVLDEFIIEGVKIIVFFYQ